MANSMASEGAKWSEGVVFRLHRLQRKFCKQREFINSIEIGGSEVYNRPTQEGVLRHVMLRAYPRRVSQGYLLVLLEFQV